MHGTVPDYDAWPTPGLQLPKLLKLGSANIAVGVTVEQAATGSNLSHSDMKENIIIVLLLL